MHFFAELLSGKIDAVSSRASCRGRSSVNDPGKNRSSAKLSKEDHMLWTIAVILIVLWLLGLVSGYTMGNFIHILLVIAIIIVLVRVIQGRKPV
jgi:hypothetical protein